MKIEDNCPTVEECLIEWLQKDTDREKAYLEVVLEGYGVRCNLDDVLRALSYIASAKGDTLVLVDSKAVDQNSLDKLLRKDVNPSLEQVIEFLGYTMLEDSGELVPSF